MYKFDSNHKIFKYQDATIETTVQVRQDLLRIAHLGGQALESDEITETEETVTRLGDKFQEMADGVVRIKSAYIDAMINWGVQLMHFEDIADQLAAIKREIFSSQIFLINTIWKERIGKIWKIVVAVKLTEKWGEN